MATEVKASNETAQDGRARVPFVLPFNHEGGCYVYDVNTNRILKLGRDVFATLIRIMADGWPADPEQEAARDPSFRTILGLRRQRLLAPHGPRPIAARQHRRCLARMIQTSLSQLTLEITEGCNLRCAYCIYTADYDHQRGHGSGKMPVETIAKALEYFYAHNHKAPVISLGFYGGEPLTALGRIQETVRMARTYRRGRETNLHMTTNGTLLTPEKYPFLVDNNFAILVSLDGPRIMHDRYRRDAGGDGTYRRIRQNLKALREYAPEFYKHNIMFSCVSPPATSHKALARFFCGDTLVRNQIAQVSGVSEGCPALMQRLYGDVQDAETLQAEDNELMEEYIDRVLARKTQGARFRFLHGSYGNSFTSLHRRTICAGKNTPTSLNGMCIPGWRKLFVATDGTLHTCERVGRSFSIGHVDTGVDENRVFEYLGSHQDFTEKHCKNCWAIRLCGACQSSLGGPAGVDWARARRYCDGERQRWTDTLVLYTRVLARDPTAFDFIEEISIG